MKKNTTFQSQFEAFTLIELITVIAIILILMGLLFPAIQSVKETAKKAQARNDISNIVVAVNAYNTEYGKYPLLQAQVGGIDTVFGDPGSKYDYTNDKLFNVLICPANWTDTGDGQSPQNPRRIVFLNANNVKNPSSPKAGISTSQTSVTAPNGDKIKQGAFVDPWGSEYVIFIDANYDGSLTADSNNGNMWGISWFYTDWQQTGVNGGCGVCSLGKDGKWGTNGNYIYQGSDDIASWQ